MAYSKYGDAVSDILKYKKWYNEAEAAGDNAGKENAANSAKAAYDFLKNNGYYNDAQTLSSMGYEDAKKWAITDKTAIRPYYQTLGKQYGMSSADVDKIIGWNNDTGQITLGGKNVGTPDVVVDGVSYISDTSALDNSFKDYVKNSGITVPSGVDNQAYNQNMTSGTDKNNKMWDAIEGDRTDVQGKYNDIFNYANSDITQTDEYKNIYDSVMAKYGLDAYQGKVNTVASGAGSNGGNVDSFSAANAMRQQAALTAQGQQIANQLGLDAYKSRIDNTRGILSDLGAYNQGTYTAMDNSIKNDLTAGQMYFDNAETAKNNETARLREKADVTGVVPDEWAWKEDPFFQEYLDENGNLKEQYAGDDIDYQSIIDNLKAQGKNDLAEKFAVLRGKKISQDLANYGKYLDTGDVAYLTPKKTAAAQSIESAENMNKYNTDAAERQMVMQYLFEKYPNLLGGNSGGISLDRITGLYSNNGNANNQSTNAVVDSILSRLFGVDTEALAEARNVEAQAQAQNKTYSPVAWPYNAGTVYVNGEENYNRSRGNTSGNTSGNTTTPSNPSSGGTGGGSGNGGSSPQSTDATKTSMDAADVVLHVQKEVGTESAFFLPMDTSVGGKGWYLSPQAQNEAARYIVDNDNITAEEMYAIGETLGCTNEIKQELNKR